MTDSPIRTYEVQIYNRKMGGWIPLSVHLTFYSAMVAQDRLAKEATERQLYRVILVEYDTSKAVA